MPHLPNRVFWPVAVLILFALAFSQSLPNDPFFLPLIARNAAPSPTTTIPSPPWLTPTISLTPSSTPLAPSPTPAREPDLTSSTLMVSRPTADAGGRLTYTVVLTNTGPMDARTHITGTLAAQTRFVPNSITGGARFDSFSHHIVWAGQVASGRSQILTYQVIIQPDVPPATFISHSITIDDGVHSPLVRQASVRTRSVNPTSLPEQIVFASTLAGGHWREVYMMDASGSHRRRLTDTEGHNTQPRPSPTGDQIAFASSRTGVFQIYVMNLDGSDQRPLTQCATNCTLPDWGPDGRILYQCGDDRVCVMNADGSGQRVLLEGVGRHGSRWASDGLSIVTTRWFETPGGWEIILLDTAGNLLHRLTHYPGWDGQPAFSPDGTHIAFVREEGIDTPTRTAIFLTDTAGETVTQLTDFRSQTWPAFSPAGTEIVYMSARDGETELYVIRIDGTQERNLTRRSAGYDDHPAWFVPHTTGP